MMCPICGSQGQSGHVCKVDKEVLNGQDVKLSFESDKGPSVTFIYCNCDKKYSDSMAAKLSCGTCPRQ